MASRKGSSAASIRGSEGCDRLFQLLNHLQVLIDKKTDDAARMRSTRGGETGHRASQPAGRVNLACRVTREGTAS